VKINKNIQNKKNPTLNKTKQKTQPISFTDTVFKTMIFQELQNEVKLGCHYLFLKERSQLINGRTSMYTVTFFLVFKLFHIVWQVFYQDEK